MAMATILSSPMPTNCNPSVSDRSSVSVQSIAVALSEHTLPCASGPDSIHTASQPPRSDQPAPKGMTARLSAFSMIA